MIPIDRKLSDIRITPIADKPSFGAHPGPLALPGKTGSHLQALASIVAG